MDRVIDVASPLGRLRLRPERDGDEDFRFDLFCNLAAAGMADGRLRSEPVAASHAPPVPGADR